MRENLSNMEERAFYAACILTFLLRMEWGIATTQLPIYVYELGASPLEVGLVFTVFAGIMMFTLPLWGYCSDYLKRRKPFMVLGMLGLSPILLAMSTQTDITSLILLRGSTAVFVGAVVPATWALVSDSTTHETVGRRMGLLTGAEVAGFGVGPLVGGMIADSLGFAALWISMSALCLVGGVVFLAFGSDPKTLSRGTREPFSIKLSWRNSSIKRFSILYTAFSFLLLGVSLLGPNRNVYLVGDLGMSRTMVGALDLIGTLSSTLLQPLAGSFSDKHGRKPLMALSALSLMLGLVTLYLARDFLQAVPSAFLMTNYNSFQLAASAYISDVTKREERGGSLGILNAVGSASRSIGAILGGLIIMATSIQTAILLSTVFPAISVLIIALLLKETKKERF